MDCELRSMEPWTKEHGTRTMEQGWGTNERGLKTKDRGWAGSPE